MTSTNGTASAPGPVGAAKVDLKPEHDPNWRPSAPLSFLLGILAPGGGLLYAGRWHIALAVFVLSLASTAALPFLIVDNADPVLLPRAMVAVGVGIYLPTVVLGVFSALTATPAKRRGFQHLWWLAGFVLVSRVADGGLRNRVGEHVAALARMEGAFMRPTLDDGTGIMILKRGFDAAQVERGALVAVRHGDQLKVLRVEGRAPDVVRVEDGRLFVDDAAVREEPCGPSEQRVPGVACAAELHDAGARHGVTSSSPACALPATTLDAGKLLLLPDDRSKASCETHGKVVATSELLGRVLLVR